MAAEVCAQCGSRLPEAAKFCPACGQSVSAVPAEAHACYEVSEIRYWHGYVSSDFYAFAVRPSGTPYVVARSPSFWWPRRGEPAQETGALAAHAVLVARLVEDRWQLMKEVADRDVSNWYAIRFRRRLRPKLEQVLPPTETAAQ